MKTKPTLLGTSPTIERMRELIGRYYVSANIALAENGANEWSVSNARGIISGVRVKLAKNGRYRFERVENGS